MLLRKNDIKINGKRTAGDYQLQVDDVVSVYTDDKYLEIDLDISFSNARDLTDIVYEDDHILVVKKPIGLIVHDFDGKSYDTLNNRILKYLAKKGYYNPFQSSSFTPGIVHRLDRNTTGLVLACKTALSMRVFNELFKNNQISRKYLVLTYKQLPKKDDTVYLFMEKDSKTNHMVVSDYKNKTNKTAITEYHFKQKYKNFFMYEVSLHTGRTHQIRATLNYLGAPIVGEQYYINSNIDKNHNYEYQCLVAFSLKFGDLSKFDEQLKYLSNKEFVLDDVWFLSK